MSYSPAALMSFVKARLKNMTFDEFVQSDELQDFIELVQDDDDENAQALAMEVLDCTKDEARQLVEAAKGLL